MSTINAASRVERAREQRIEHVENVEGSEMSENTADNPSFTVPPSLAQMDALQSQNKLLEQKLERLKIEAQNSREEANENATRVRELSEKLHQLEKQVQTQGDSNSLMTIESLQQENEKLSELLSENTLQWNSETKRIKERSEELELSLKHATERNSSLLSEREDATNQAEALQAELLRLRQELSNTTTEKEKLIIMVSFCSNERENVERIFFGGGGISFH